MSVSIKPWIKRGKMLLNTSALEPNDPDHVYNQILKQGKIPEEYGIDNPKIVRNERFKNKTRNELIEMIFDLEKQLASAEQFM